MQDTTVLLFSISDAMATAPVPAHHQDREPPCPLNPGIRNADLRYVFLLVAHQRVSLPQLLQEYVVNRASRKYIFAEALLPSMGTVCVGPHFQN